MSGDGVRTLRAALGRLSRLLLAVALTSGCAPSPPVAPLPPPARPPPREACPLGVAGASVVVEDTADGIALVFTSPERTAELRDRARGAARLHGPYGRQGKGHDGRHGGGGHHGLEALTLGDARAVANDVDDGARITFVPNLPTGLEALRAKVRARAAKMSTAPCDH